MEFQTQPPLQWIEFCQIIYVSVDFMLLYSYGNMHIYSTLIKHISKHIRCISFLHQLFAKCIKIFVVKKLLIPSLAPQFLFIFYCESCGPSEVSEI